MYVVYLLTKRPPPRLTVTHKEWDDYMKNHPYEAPDATAVRSPCPFLNTCANHGILPRSGYNITYDQYYKAITVVGTTHEAAIGFLSIVYRLYKEIDPAQSVWSDLHPADHLSLNQLGLHNMVEHDVSLTRRDISEQPDYSRPDPDRVQSLIDRVGSSKKVNVKHVGDFRRTIWKESMQKQLGGYHFGGFYQFAAAIECVLLLDYIGRDHSISVAHLESFVLEERIPKDWYPMEKPLTNWQLFTRTRSCLMSVRKSKA
ncbi:Chloroperoxidase [Chlamydoabsidia padenii]|nr:Chloroperoxidase [Chlamydoabsidia padenii]